MSPVAENVVSRSPLLAAVEARAKGLGIPGFVGEAGAVDAVEGDPLGRVAPYYVIHPWAGNPSGEQNLSETSVDLDWGFQITIASGFTRDTLAVVGEADALFYRWTPVVAEAFGYVAGKLIPPPGYQPTLLTDRGESPHRFYVPLQYGTTITHS